MIISYIYNIKNPHSQVGIMYYVYVRCLLGDEWGLLNRPLIHWLFTPGVSQMLHSFFALLWWHSGALQYPTMRHTSAFLAGAVVGMVLYFVLFPNPSIFIRRHEAHTIPEELIVRKLLDTFYKDNDVELWPSKDQTDFKFEDYGNSEGNFYSNYAST